METQSLSLCLLVQKSDLFVIEYFHVQTMHIINIQI